MVKGLQAESAVQVATAVQTVSGGQAVADASFYSNSNK